MWNSAILSLLVFNCALKKEKTEQQLGFLPSIFTFYFLFDIVNLSLQKQALTGYQLKSCPTFHCLLYQHGRLFTVKTAFSGLQWWKDKAQGKDEWNFIVQTHTHARVPIIYFLNVDHNNASNYIHLVETLSHSRTSFPWVSTSAL